MGVGGSAGTGTMGEDRPSAGSSTPDAGPPRKRRVRTVVLRTLGVIGLLLVLAFGILYAFFRRDLAQAKNRLASISTDIYATRYGDIQYRVVGDGPAVLISHGITGGVDAGEYLVTKWRNLEEDYRFIYVSRFGYLGSSIPEDATPQLQAAVYRDLLDHLGLERAFIVANSAGGPAGMWFAIDYPERTSGLILLSSAVPGPLADPIPRFVAENDFVYWAAIKFAPDALIGMLLPQSIRETLTEDEKEFIIENAYMASLPISERTEGIVFDNEVSNPAINDVPFERIETPTLILQSVDDPRELEGGREMARRIPDNEYIGLTGGHFLLRHQSEIRSAIAEFIAEHAA